MQPLPHRRPGEERQYGIERRRLGAAADDDPNRRRELAHFQAVRGQRFLDRGGDAGGRPLDTLQLAGERCERRANRICDVLGQVFGARWRRHEEHRQPGGQFGAGVAAVLEDAAGPAEPLGIVGHDGAPRELLPGQRDERFARQRLQECAMDRGAMVGIPLLVTLRHRKVDHLYVSVWYIMGAYVWFPIIYFIGNWPSFTGVESAAVNWFYAHNVLGLWLTAINLGAVYYLIPKILGRPIFSYQLSLLGFWSLAFFYALNGMHHLIGGPLPTWMITTSIVASALMIIPVLAVAVNHHMTMFGRFGALRYSPALRFIVLGAISYTAVSLQGMFTALRSVNRITHFTHWTIAHAHVGVYGFVIGLYLQASQFLVLPCR